MRRILVSCYSSVLVACCVVTVQGVCWQNDTPTAILGCLEAAMETENLGTVAELLAADFVSNEQRGEDLVQVADKAGLVAQHEVAFKTMDVVDAAFGASPTVTSVKAGLWKIETSWTNRVRFQTEEEATVSMEESILLVREVAKPLPHFELVSWTNVIPQ